MSDAEGANRLKTAAAPAAGAVAIVASLLAVSIATGLEEGGQTPNAPLDLVAAAPALPGPPLPGPSLPGVAFNQGVPGAPGVQMSVEFVVKFKDDAKVKDIIDAFWRDKANAQTRFDTFKARQPAFEGLSLDRVTYSNELVLTQTAGQPPLTPAAMRAMAAKLSAVADISYAEPNMTAHPGGR